MRNEILSRSPPMNKFFAEKLKKMSELEFLVLAAAAAAAAAAR